LSPLTRVVSSPLLNGRRFDISAHIAAQFADNLAEKNGGADAAGGLKIAGASGLRMQDKGPSVVITLDKDPEMLRREREEAAAARRQQNQLPEWHLKSTINGELTALGHIESVREAAESARMQGDEALVGLGRAVPTSAPRQSPDASAGADVLMMNSDVDVKPDLRNEMEVDRA
jgi:transcription initiation factor TFIIE subunit alpha